MAVNPGLPDTITGGGGTRALVNSNSTIAVLNARPSYTVLVPALDQDIFCSAMCALTQDNCLRQCAFAVRNFYSVRNRQPPSRMARYLFAVPRSICPNIPIIRAILIPNSPIRDNPKFRSCLLLRRAFSSREGGNCGI